MKCFKLPDLGEGLAEAEIVQWHVAVGEQVRVDQKLVSVETAKAIVEIPSPVTGTVLKCFGEVGEVVHIGEPLVEFSGEGEDSGTVVGHIKTASAEAEEDYFIIGSANTHPPLSTPVQALPSVRAAAKRYGLDLKQLKGTGPEGHIRLEDVEQARMSQDQKGTLELLKGPRKAMAKAMADAHAQVVPVTLWDDADLHAWLEGEDLTIRLVHAIAMACKAEPALNVWFNAEQQVSRRLLKTIDLGIAVDTEQGLFVPVLRDIGNKNLKTLRDELERIRKGINDRSIAPADMVGATITLSNFGMIAGRYASPIVVPPTVAIIGAGRLHDAVVAVNGKAEVHPILPISLTFDHRAMTGGEVARFLRALLDDLQQPGAE